MPQIVFQFMPTYWAVGVNFKDFPCAFIHILPLCIGVHWCKGKPDADV